MPTYYEILRVQTTATPAEIQTAYESQYNHWRRLVTHHEPEVVGKANQALRILEQIRHTLTDPRRRVAYDRSLYTGLTDPEAGTCAPQVPTPSSPSQSHWSSHSTVSPAQPHADERVDVWVCPKCDKANALHSKFCKECGHTIGIDCPDCGTIIETNASFCPSCGTNVPQAVRRKELEALLTAKREEMANMEQINPQRDKEVKNLRSVTVAAGAWMSLGLVLAANLVLYWVIVSQDTYYGFGPIPLLVVFGAQLVFILVLAIARRAFSLSSLMACLCGLTMPLDPFGYYVSVLDYAVLAVYVLAVWRLGSNLARYGCWARSLVVFVILLIICSALSPFWWDIVWWELASDYQAYLGDYSTGAVLINVGCNLLGAMVLSVLSIRAWWLTRRIEHQVAAALANKRSQMERLQREIWNLSQEVNVLQQ